MGVEALCSQELRRTIEAAIGSVKGANEAVHDLLIGKVRDGFFEEHQTKGRIDAVADEVLRKLRSGEPGQGDSK